MRLVVIGGVAAGLSAAARARRLDPSLDITVLEKGDTVSYGACGLPYYVEGRVRRAGELIVYTPEYFRKERRIDVRTGTAAMAISHARREIGLAGGEKIRYDRLVIATGATADRGIAGADLPHVFTLQTLRDAERMKAFLVEKKPDRAVVVGGGYIGLEAADALRRRGLSVKIVTRGENLLHREDPGLREALRNHLARHQVELQTGRKVCSAAELDADLVVLGIGMKPNVELAREAGVEVGRTGAIRTSEKMETNVGGIYAAGDCAETVHLVSGKPVWIPLGTTANKMGRVAGANAAGKRERFPGVVGTSILSVFGMGIGMTGLAAAQARREGFRPASIKIEARAKAKYFHGRPTTVELVADRGTGKLLGATVLGEQGVAGRINVVAAALQAGMTVEEFEGLDLAYAPPFAPTWDPLLICAQQLRKEL
jgi:NADPH-dependent 2,4-dienoyl-CoA reductase/sulfur reductase-like enzyme